MIPKSAEMMMTMMFKQRLGSDQSRFGTWAWSLLGLTQ